MEFDYSIIKFPCSIAFFFYNVLSVQENEITQEFANKLTFTSEFEKFAQNNNNYTTKTPHNTQFVKD